MNIPDMCSAAFVYAGARLLQWPHLFTLQLSMLKVIPWSEEFNETGVL